MLELEAWSLGIVNQPGKSIVLIGMMGAGKSCVGRCLQQRTKLALVDTDDIVASKFGISIPEIFSKYGEQANVDFLKRLGVIVWLDGNKETLFERTSRARTRPLLKGENPRETFTQLLQLRLPLYAKVAHIRVDTSVLTDEEVTVAILSKLRKLGRNWRVESSAFAEATTDKPVSATR